MAGINDILGRIITALDEMPKGEGVSAQYLAHKCEIKPETAENWFEILWVITELNLTPRIDYHGSKKIKILAKSEDTPKKFNEILKLLKKKK